MTKRNEQFIARVVDVYSKETAKAELNRKAAVENACSKALAKLDQKISDLKDSRDMYGTRYASDLEKAENARDQILDAQHWNQDRGKFINDMESENVLMKKRIELLQKAAEDMAHRMMHTLMDPTADKMAESYEEEVKEIILGHHDNDNEEVPV